jgi:chromosome segregation ATPase
LEAKPVIDTHSPPKSPGRPGLQRKDVAEAIDALMERGIRTPSLAQLREHLGRGSNGTISRLRNEIQGERLLATRTPVEGSIESSVLPTLVSAMERLGEEAAKAADDQIDAMRSTFEAAQSKMTRERDEAVAAAHDIRIELTARADQVKDLHETIKALRAEISDERKRLGRAETARRKFETQAHALSVDLKSMTAARDRLDKALSDKSTALDQTNATHDALQKTHTVLLTAHAEMEATFARQAETVEQGGTLIQELRSAKVLMEKRAAAAEQNNAITEASAAATIDALNARLSDQQGVINSLIDKIGE